MITEFYLIVYSEAHITHLWYLRVLRNHLKKRNNNNNM